MKAINRVITDLVPTGLFLASFHCYYNNRCNPGKHDDCEKHGCLDNDDLYISEIEPSVEKVTVENYLKLPANVINKDTSMNTPENYDDTHDLRARLFNTKKEAQSHVKYTVDRFTNPQPWECFVKTA